MEILGFHMSRGGGGSRIAVMMMVAFALCARSVMAQNTLTYVYTGNPFSVAECQQQNACFPPDPCNPLSGACYPCASGGLTAVLTVQGLPAGYTGAISCTPPPTTFGQPAICSCGGQSCNVREIVMAAAGATAIATAGPGGTLTGAVTRGIYASFGFQNGSIVNWFLELTTGASAAGGNNPFGAYPGGVDLFTRNLAALGSQDFAMNGLTWPPILGLIDSSPGTWTPGCPVNVSPYPYLPKSKKDGEYTSMNASFTPTDTNGNPLGLDAAAKACGFAGFDWVQTVNQNQGGLYAENAPTVNLKVPPGSFSDPPYSGYTYDFDCEYPYSCVNPSGNNICYYPPDCDQEGFRNPWLNIYQPNFANAFPFYYSPLDIPSYSSGACPSAEGECCAEGYMPSNGQLTYGCQVLINSEAFPKVNLPGFYTLNFWDSAQNTSCTGPAPCFTFTTALVGICDGSSSSPACNSSGPSAPLYQWTWYSNYNMSSGEGGAWTANYFPADGSGTGGVTITSINGVQLPPVVLSSSQVATTASGLAYSRVSKTFNGTVTIQNISGSPINGPLQIFFMGLTAGVTLANATNNLSGTPYLTVPGVASLAPGQKATVNVQFSDPSNAPINFTPVIYSGSMN